MGRGEKTLPLCCPKSTSAAPKISDAAWVANVFYLLAQGPWCYANVRARRTSGFLRFEECFVKCIVFCFQRAGLSAPGTSPPSSLLNDWYAARCTSERMGNPEEPLRRRNRPHVVGDRIDIGCSRIYGGVSTLTAAVRDFTQNVLSN